MDIECSKSRCDWLTGLITAPLEGKHERLREVFEVEMKARRDGENMEHRENLYRCAYCLYRIGDPVDVVAMWEAKHIDEDTGFGFDVQYFVGAGYEETVRYLSGVGREDIVDELRKANGLGDFMEMEMWERAVVAYFR